MKLFDRLFFYSLFFCAFFLSITYTSSGRTLAKLSAKFVVITNNGTTFRVQLQVKTDSANKDLGATTLIFNFNSSTMKFHNNGVTGTLNTDYVWASGFGHSGNSNYNASSKVTQPITGKINVVLDYFNVRDNAGSNATAISNSSWTPVVDIIFTITNSSGTTSLNWNMNTTGPSNDSLFDVYDDVIDPADPSGNVYLHYDVGTFTDLGSVPLPVTLVNFSAVLQNHETILKWITSSEINNAYFTIERSADGIQFEPLFTKAGAGNSQKRLTYTAYDESPLPGISYYRLTQTDFNGATETFNIVSINNTDPGEFVIQNISPTNFSDFTIVTYKMPSDGPVKMVVTNMSGKIISDQMLESTRGENSHRFDETSGWQPGMYIVSLYYDGRYTYSKMIKH